MRVVIVYRDESDHAREVYDYLRDYQHRTGRELATVNPDTATGQSLCRAYDIVEYPSIMAMADDSQLLHLWRGTPLPPIDEVRYYDQ